MSRLEKKHTSAGHSVGIPVDPKSVRWGWGSGLGAGQSSSSTHTGKKCFFMDLTLPPPSTIGTKLEEHCRVKYCML